MPLFVFECTDCHVQAELLVSGKGEALCPSCGSSSVGKLPSAFAPMRGGRTPESAPMTCGVSNCCMGQGGRALN